MSSTAILNSLQLVSTIGVAHNCKNLPIGIICLLMVETYSFSNRFMHCVISFLELCVFLPSNNNLNF